MRKLAFVAATLLAVSAVAAPPAHKRVKRAGYLSGGGGAALLEAPSAYRGLLFIGQSLNTGACGGGTCAAQSTTPSATSFILHPSTGAFCPAAEGGGCGYTDIESPARGALDVWDSIIPGAVPGVGAAVAIKAAVGSTSVNDWEIGDTATTNALALLADAVATAGGSGFVVDVVSWTQGEADFLTYQTADYAAKFLTVKAAINAAIKSATGQSSDPIWVLAPPSTWALTASLASAPRAVGDQAALCRGYADIVCADYKVDLVYDVAPSTPPSLHLQAPSYRILGERIGLAGALARLYGQQTGVYLSSVVLSGSTATACVNQPTGWTVANNTATCAARTNNGWTWGSDTIGGSAITGVTGPDSSGCYTLTLDNAPLAGTGARAQLAWRSSGAPLGVSGCALAGTGFPYANVTATRGAQTLWAQADELAATGGLVDNCHSSTLYHLVQSGTEQVLTPDHASLDVTTAASWLVVFSPASTTVHTLPLLDRVAAWSPWNIRGWDYLGNHGIALNVGAIGQQVKTSTGLNMQVGTTYILVITYAAGVVKIYANGVEQPTITTGTIPTSIAASASGLRLGATSGALTGNVSQVALWDRTLTLYEVLRLSQREVDVAAVAPTPLVWFRPDSDDLTTWTNYGSVGAALNGVGTNITTGEVAAGGLTSCP